MQAPQQAQTSPFRDRAELLDFLLEVGSAASSTLDLESLLDRLAGYVRAIVGSELIAILLYSERHRGLRVRHQSGYPPDLVRDLVIPLDEGITGIAASARMTINSGDVANDPRYLPVLDAVKSEIAVPMTVRGKLVGVIDVQSTTQHAFTTEHSALMQLVASRVSASIAHARLYRRVERNNKTLRSLSSLSREFSSILDLDELLGRVAKAVRKLIPYDAFSLLLLDESTRTLRSRFSQRFDERFQLDNIPVGKGLTGAAAETRKPVRVEDTLRDPRYLETSPGIRSEVSIPLLLQDRVVGVLDLESERVGHFTEDHVRTLQLMAPLIATAVDNAKLYEEVNSRKERMEADLAAAQRLQQTLLPREDPGLRGLEIGIKFRPAAEISGDVFDFFETGEQAAVITFGDVSGKSAAAALYGAMVTGLLRTLAPRRRSPSALMQSLNEALLERKAGDKYLTLLVCLWEPRSSVFTISNAAAIPPLVIRGSELLSPHIEGLPLGLMQSPPYEEYRLQTQEDDLILLFSDGIQDQPDASKAVYGEARLRQFLPGVAHLPPRQLVDAIFEDFDRFRGEERIQDDQTIVAIRVKGEDHDIAL